MKKKTKTIEITKALSQLRREASDLAIGVELIRSHLVNQQLDALLDEGEIENAEWHAFFRLIAELSVELHGHLKNIGCRAGELYLDTRQASSTGPKA